MESARSLADMREQAPAFQNKASRKVTSMKLRSITTILLAVIMIALVMGVSYFFASNGSAAAEKYSSESLWSQSYSAAESMKIIDVTGDGTADLFIQNSTNVSVYDGLGNEQASIGIGSGKTTLGDVNADGVEDIIVYDSSNPNVNIISRGTTTQEFYVPGLGTPSRNALMKFVSGPQIILGDTSGNLISVNPDGIILWQNSVGSEEFRGMDDARVNGKIYLAVASHSGNLAVLGADGTALWTAVTEQLRRMRAYDLFGDGTSEILSGGEYGEFVIWNAATGERIFTKSLGQAISEIRSAEINGDPASIEIIVGGKDGGVWAFDASGNELWSRSVADKVTEIVGVDFDDDGAQEIVIGDETGAVNVFSSAGARSKLTDLGNEITRIDEGRLNGERVLAVSSLSELQVHKVIYSALPGFENTPLLVGLIVSLAILGVAWVLATLPPKPQMKVSIQDKSRESLEAERRMLKESIADVERLRKAGEVTGGAYLARLKQLRGDLAENETAFKTQGFPIKVETFACPNCGGTLELGMDKCEYCGHVILT